MTLLELLDQLQKVTGAHTDAALARVLNVSKQTIGQYRSGRSQPGPETQLLIAELLDMPPEKVAATIMAHRAKDRKTRERWLKASAAALLFGLASVMMPHPAEAKGTSVYYVKYRRRLLERLTAWRAELAALQHRAPAPQLA